MVCYNQEVIKESFVEVILINMINLKDVFIFIVKINQN